MSTTEESASAEELLVLAEQLTQQVELLRQENVALQSQLSAVLAAQHTPILRHGEGTRQFALNARSVGSIFLTQEPIPNSYPQGYHDRWAVMADAHHLTAYLEEAAAVAAFEQAVAAWIAALAPPTNRS